MTQMENILYPQKLHIFHALTKLNFTYTLRPTKTVKRLQIFSQESKFEFNGF